MDPPLFIYTSNRRCACANVTPPTRQETNQPASRSRKQTKINQRNKSSTSSPTMNHQSINRQLNQSSIQTQYLVPTNQSKSIRRKQSIDWSINQSTTQLLATLNMTSIARPTNQPINQPKNQPPIKQPTKKQRMNLYSRRERPKSAILPCNSRPSPLTINTFSALKSVCIHPAVWTCFRPNAASRRTLLTAGGYREGGRGWGRNERGVEERGKRGSIEGARPV